MCAIVGWIDTRAGARSDPVLLQRMNATLAHRGPDDAGTAIFDGAALAMSRLSIIDRQGGRQPLTNEDGTCSIVFNGEIYNFAALRTTLEARGHRFRTRSDTEVILHSYEEWGTDCVHRLRGMFAFAILDRRGPPGDRATLVLARDRVGKKPLYYHAHAGLFVFASEIKALLVHPDVPRRVHTRVVPLYLAHGYVPAPHTMFEGIHELPPGHVLTVRQGHMAVREYEDVVRPADVEPSLPEPEIAARVRALLEDAVRVRLVAEVPVGAFLSGGLDSSAVVALMARHSSERVKTFAIGFADDPSFNELAGARAVARLFGTEHHEFVVRADAVELLPKLVWHHDQPFADSSAIPTYLVSKLTREHATVALTGDGGDEAFAGYERFAAVRVAEGYRHVPQLAQAAVARVLDALPESTRYHDFVRRARRFVSSAPLPVAQRYLGWIGVFQEGFIRELLAGPVEMDPGVHFQGYFEPVETRDPLGQLLYVTAKTYLPGDLLVKADRMSMANALEVRCPFLDQELLAFTAKLPSHLKLRAFTTKYVLRRALAGLVPRTVLARKKHGFGVPVGRWFRGHLRGYVRDLLLGPRAQARGYFREPVLRRLIDEHERGARDHGHRLWALLTFETWHRVFFEREPGAA
jgi:asparagine synthase (glutamine-hydrolysing)